MAKLFQSEWNEIKSRRGVQDLNNLIEILDADGTVEIVDDPTEDEIKAARKKAAKDAEAKQKEAEAAAEDEAAEAEDQAAADAEAAETARIASMSIPEDNPPPAVEGQEASATGEEEVTDESKKGDGRRKKEE